MEATLNKNENYTWKFVNEAGNIMEFCHCGNMGTLHLAVVQILKAKTEPATPRIMKLLD